MKFSEKWLREWVNPPINNIQLINQLTMLGLKVDESKPIANIFHGVIIGEIIECKIHPKLCHLRILTVNNGSEKPLNIISNADNCRKNLRVAVAILGTLLPNGKTVKLKYIYNQVSEGMLCSFSMLGLAVIDNTKNIIELPVDAPIGQEFYNYCNLDDNIIDISITPNRGDCLSILGIAREIASINNLKLKKIKIKKIYPTIHDTIPIIIKEPKACPQFFGRILKNINTNINSPLWIREKLRRCGILPTNIVTDITNYVLLELGHPIHVFDYEKIDNKIIYIRFAKPGEILKLSNKNINIKLLPNTLIIADHTKPLSIAGITVDNRSDISTNTNNIILQSAFFDPSIIIGQSRLYNIHTLASFRYERGVDPRISKLALDRATLLLLEICGGYPGPIISIIKKHKLLKPIVITLHRITLDKILGFHISDLEIIKILNNLGFIIETLNNTWKVTIPTWRFNLSIEEHLISEIIRIYGYHNIPLHSICTKYHTLHPDNTLVKTPLSRAKTLLIDRGYQEVITYSFVNPHIQKLLYPKKTALTIINPIKPEMSAMRLSLWIGLIEALIFNQNRQQKHIQLFESGICFTPKNIVKHKINQNLMIAGIRSGFRFHENWGLSKYPVDFYDIKGDVESLINITGNACYITFKKHPHSALHPGQSAAIYLNNTCIGYVGMLHPIIQTQLNLHSHILVFELSWHLICKKILKLPKYINISKFPKNYSDVSIIIPDNITADSVINIFKETIKDQLIEIKLSDVYTGKDIPNGFKGLTIKLSLQSKTHTLHNEEIANILDKCLIYLKQNFHATVR